METDHKQLIYIFNRNRNGPTSKISTDSSLVFRHHRTVVENLRAEQLWELLFADDLAIIADWEKQLQQRLLKWPENLEKYGLTMNEKKTETLECCKNGDEQVGIKDAHGEEMKQVKSFKYLGSLMNNKRM